MRMFHNMSYANRAMAGQLPEARQKRSLTSRATMGNHHGKLGRSRACPTWNDKFRAAFLRREPAASGSRVASMHNFPIPQLHKVTAVSKVRALDIRGKAAAPLDTPTDLSAEAVSEISAQLNGVLATTFALYLKTKNFHWHVSGPHFRDYHLLLDEQGEQIFDSTDDIAERVRKIGGTTLRSIGQISKLQSIEDNNESFVAPGEMVRELMADNKKVVQAMRECHETCDKYGDVATASILENFIDEAERRVWFLFETSRKADETGH
jgi:starvation-inducible DNA-binding protein